MSNKRVVAWLLSVCFVVLLFCFVEAVQKSAPSANTTDIYGGLGLATDTIPFMQKVRKGTLPNGLQYYILKNDKPENRAYLTLVVNAGSILEEDNERGIAHFVEHMVFQGTKRFPNKSDIIDYFRSKGMRFGADENAYTSFNETVYRIEIPVEPNGRIPQEALNIIDDWIYDVSFDSKNINDERLVILEEKRLTTASAYERVFEKINQIEYKGSKYAVRLPIGMSEILENAERAS
jgi:zinc protease